MSNIISLTVTSTVRAWGEAVADPQPPVWLTVKQAAARAQVGPKTIYRSVAAGRLRAARIGGRRDLRLLAAWVDEFLIASSEPVNVRR
jgi:excisionase family DNA binding protein